MRKTLMISSLSMVLLLAGCSTISEQKQTEKEDSDIEELFAGIEREEEKKLKLICEQEMIPAEYASDCYFHEFKNCDSLSGEMIPRAELEKCVPYFLKEEIESVSSEG